MIELDIFLLLNFLGALFTILIIGFKTLPSDDDEIGGWQGIAFIAAIVACIIWLVCGVAAVDLGYSQQSFSMTGGTITPSTYQVRYNDTWPLAIVYVLISIIPFVLLFYLFPETWKFKIRW